MSSPRYPFRIVRNSTTVSVGNIHSDVEIRPTSPELESSLGILGAEGRKRDMCEPATVGTESVIEVTLAYESHEVSWTRSTDFK